jgi:hypothetical protein
VPGGLMNLAEEFKLYENMWIDLQEGSKAAKAAKPTPEDYLKEITKSKEAIISFVVEKMKPYADRSTKCEASQFYSTAVAKESNAAYPEIYTNKIANYQAFLQRIALFGLSNKHVYELLKTGSYSSPEYDANFEYTQKSDRPSPRDYFEKITCSKEAVLKFIRDKLTIRAKNSSNFNMYSEYYLIIARETNSNITEIIKDPTVNVIAFFNKAAEFGLSRADIHSIITTGDICPSHPDRVSFKNYKPTPEEYFAEITSSKEAVIQFILEKVLPYAKANERFSMSRFYALALTKETTKSYLELVSDAQVGYKAFLLHAQQVGVTKKDIHTLIKSNLNLT